MALKIVHSFGWRYLDYCSLSDSPFLALVPPPLSSSVRLPCVPPLRVYIACLHSLQYFTNKDPDNLSMSGSYNDNGDGLTEWYQSTPGVECYVGDKALKIDREAKTVISESGKVRKYTRSTSLEYDNIVFSQVTGLLSPDEFMVAQSERA